MIGALVYLQLTSLKNAVRLRLKRLRTPRYLFAALVGAAYFYFVLFRSNGGKPPSVPLAVSSPFAAGQGAALLESAGACLLFAAVVLAWVLPNSRAALAFTEAEVAHLFPAPVSRRTLIHYKLLKSQVSVLFSAVFLTLISNRWSFLGGGALVHAAGWWLIFSLYNLHLVGASFARERLLHFGIDGVRRRLYVLAALLALGAGTWLWLKRSLPLPTENGARDVASLIDYVQTVLATPPLAWALAPFRWSVRPFFATDIAGFLAAVWPGLLLLVVHYWWVLRSDVAFEEASVALSQKRAAALADVRAGKWPGGGPKRKRPEPFPLAPTGWPSMAFLWKGLIAAGPLYYPRYWLLTGVFLLAGLYWFGNEPAYRLATGGVLGVCVALSLYGILFGPVLARRGLASMLERLDLVKSYPLRGWQVVLGELLCPVTMLCVFEWVVLALAALSALLLQEGEADPALVLSGLLGTWVAIGPLAGLLFALNYAGALYFPAWLGASQQGAGIERFGQRLIFFAGYMVVMILALLPAVVLGALPFLVLYLFTDLVALALGLGLAVAGAMLLGELAVVVWWLGRRLENFDLSAELPR